MQSAQRTFIQDNANLSDIRIRQNNTRLPSATRWSCIKMGELAQSHSDRWLVGMPFPLRASAVATVSMVPGVRIDPVSFRKTKRLCEALLRDQGLEGAGVDLKIELPVATGMGCATSTVSMKLGAEATAAALGISLDRNWLGRAMAAIEPSDADLTDGRVAMWEFFRGTRLSCDYLLPHGSFVAAYPSGKPVDTDVVHGRRPKYLSTERRVLQEMRSELLSTFDERSIERLAVLTSISAEINNCYFPKPEFELLRDLRARNVALGFFVAHSGSVVGLVGRLGKLEEMIDTFAKELGPGYEIFGFDNDHRSERIPFLVGCGSRVLHRST